MKTIENSKDITTLEVDDMVVFGDLKYTVTQGLRYKRYFLNSKQFPNIKIFNVLNINKGDFIEKLGIDAACNCEFPEAKSLEALTAIVSALFREYEKQNELPKTWEEFCDRNPIKKEECWIECFDGKILGFADTRIAGKHRDLQMDKNVCTSKQEAEAFLALMQLRQLRKCYIGDWEPNWMSDTEPKYCIMLQCNDFDIQCWYHMNNPFSFPTYELAEQFLTNFKDLLEVAKPLL